MVLEIPLPILLTKKMNGHVIYLHGVFKYYRKLPKFENLRNLSNLDIIANILY